MNNLLIKNIKELIQVREANIVLVAGSEMQHLPTIKNAFLKITNGRIENFGEMKNCPKCSIINTIDAKGKIVLPTWCDSHTHTVFPTNRAQEFVDKIKGMSYQDIASKGGGIINSALETRKKTLLELVNSSKTRIHTMIKQGTGAVEIKSGYGLDLNSEIKMLEVIQTLKKEMNIPIKATCLAAHAVPPEMNKKTYIDLIINHILPKITENKLAEFIDVFCEKEFFTAEETDKILKAGIAHQLIPKIHVNQFNIIGGVKIGVINQALSVDHLEVINNEDIQILKASKTMPVCLPACSFFMNIPYTPARKMLAEGLPLAIATDYNPGTAPSGNMNFVVALACIKLKLTPEEAINAATINAAFAMNLEHEVGSITIGKKANLIITQPLDSYYQIPYSFGESMIEQVFINGKKYV